MKNNNMYVYETKYRLNGYKIIAGLDEVGRGCWAGPLVVAAVILPLGYRNDAIKDSKVLSCKKRSELFDVIIKVALDYAIVWMSALEVDKLNPKQASIVGMKRAINELKRKPDVALIDAEKLDIQTETNSIIKGDEKSISIAAASILAKVSRERYMEKISNDYPHFHFEQNKGYGTIQHLKAISKYGPIKNLHRFSYKPIQIAMKNKTVKVQRLCPNNYT